MQTRPSDPKLASKLDKAVRQGAQIRYADDTKVVAWYPPKNIGCIGMIIFWTLVVITVGIALLFGILAMMDKRGTLITWELKRSGRIKKKVKYKVD